MFAKMFGVVSKSQFEKWLGRVSIFGIIWNGGIFIYLTTSNLPTRHTDFKNLIILLTVYTIIMLSFAFVWSKFIGRNKFNKFYYLKIATFLWTAASIITILVMGPAVVSAIILVNFVTIYFLLSSFETYASTDRA